MLGVDLLIAESELGGYRNEIVALITVLVALALAKTVDRTLVTRGRRLSTAMSGGELSAVTDTRLRLVRRLVFASIIVLGVALALSQFDAVRRTATGVLASSAVLGLVIGFAARQTLANIVAGILLAVTQPIRIGDLVTFEGATGTVEDIRLTYTYIRADDGSRIVVPNERLAQTTIENHTIVDPRVHVEVSLWIPPEADAARALAVLREDPQLDARIADVDKDGVRLVAATWAESPAQRAPVAAGIRASALERLRGAGSILKVNS